MLAINCLYSLQGSQPVVEIWVVWSWGWFAAADGSWCSGDYSGCLPFSSLIRSWLACPSPPGQLLVACLLLLVRGCSTLPCSSASRIQSMFWCGGAVLENCDVLLMVWCWLNGCCFLWPCSSPPAAGSAGCSGAASSSLSQMTELLVSSYSACHPGLIWSSLLSLWRCES
jgi:hypothetical protein